MTGSDAPGTAAGGGYECTVTSYAAAREQVLEVRNANRGVAQTGSYLDWRYETSADAPEPKIFWLNAPTGAVVGMAAVIFRPYWVGSRRMYLPVVGDIAVDSSLRGQGLGRQLLGSLTRYLEQNYADRPALVIPTEVARKTLAALGWVTGGQLVPHVFLVDPSEQLRARLRSARLSSYIAAAYRRCMSLYLRSKAVGPECLQECTGFDSAFDELWQRRFQGESMHSESIQRELSASSLEWRYARHPLHRFRVIKLQGPEGLRGFIVFEQAGEATECSVHDIFVRQPDMLPGFLAAFLLSCMRAAQVKAVRFTLSDTHPYRNVVRRLGFVPRHADSVVFQVLYPANSQVSARPGAGASWSMTFGDKDI